MPRRPIRLPLVWAAWTVPAVLSTFETMMFYRLEDRPMELWRAFVTEAAGWYTWALFTPLIAILAVRLPLRRPVRPLAIAAHFAGWLTVAGFAALTSGAASHWLRGARAPLPQVVRNWFLSGLPFTVLGYTAVVAILYTVADREALRERERQATELARQLTEAQLTALRSQLQPHFLFNAINAIVALVRDSEGPRAVQALTTLSDILRSSLRLGATPETSLAAEVAFTRAYLELERIRFSDRLTIRFDIPPGQLDAAVPTFVLQPFVENSIKHGLMDSRAGITIVIAAALDRNTLVLTITDNGAGIAPAAAAPGAGGVGIANVRARLAAMYGDKGAVTVRAAAGGGTVAEIRIPSAKTTVA